MSTWGTVRYSARDLVDALQAQRPADERHYPTDEQQRIIESGPEPLLVVAGAGSGKTHTMTDRVVWLVANGFVRPEEILGVTFTRKAAGELAQRINAAIARLAADEQLDVPLDPADIGRASVSTYHSYANALVADHGLRIGVEPDARLIGEAQSFQLASRVVREFHGDLSFTSARAATLVKRLRQLAGDCAEHLVAPERVKEYLAGLQAEADALPLKRGRGNAKTRGIVEMIQMRTVLADMVTAYSDLKRAESVMDYGDLVAHAARIASEIPEVGIVERQRYKVVLLDEFQDTSHAQMELFSGLFGSSSGTGIGHPVTAVGDPNQSIYGFRGASAGQLFSFPERFPTLDDDGARHPAATAQLTTAWRNAEHILDGANAIAAPLRSAGTTQQIAELKPRLGAPAGEIVAHWFTDTATEAARIAEMFAEQLPADSGRTGAVLCRARSQFTPIAEALDAAGVPYEIIGLSGLLRTPEVIELNALLNVLADPTRSDSLIRVITNARWRIGPADIWVLQEHARGLARNRPGAQREQAPEDVDSSSLIEALLSLPPANWTSPSGRHFSAEGHRRLTQLGTEITRLSTQLHLPLPELIRYVERSTGLGQEVLSHPGSTMPTARRNLDAFIEAAESFAASADPTAGDELLAFLTWLDVAEEEEDGLNAVPAEPTADAVQLLTAHASKGLEWDVVVVPGLARKTFPSEKKDLWTKETQGSLPWDLRGDAASLPQWRRDGWDTLNDWAEAALGRSEKQVEEHGPDFTMAVDAHVATEERRLAYVAYTRAKDLLWISGAAWKGTAKTQGEPSVFLTEMQDHPAVTVGTWATEEEIGESNPTAERTLAAEWPYDPLDGPTVLNLQESANLSTDGATDMPSRLRPRRAGLEAAAQRVRDAEADLSMISTPDLAQRVSWVLDRRHAQRGRPADTSIVLPSHVSTSTFVELADDPTAVARQLRRPMPRQPKPAARAGTVFHSWIEEHYATIRPGVTGMLDFEDPHLAVDDDVDAALGVTDLREKFKATRWADTPPALVEAAVETTVGGITLRGRVDAIFRTGGDPSQEFDPDAQWELVDWKTGQVPRTEDDLQLKGLQLAVYRLAWSRLHHIPLENITGRFVYIAHGVERTPHHLADEAELERILAEALA
ncbi:ATP-dependent DNA helicase [Citricoccus muralis]|uniref:DNA 3'-5' helicase n=1 Tax=Citricoccus muralis TaxID=169134 RepID=A0ABY8H3F9_9MICC|nr:ATP-dependent DNA helicase [Citricoccus muralis]WFP15665.1 ATP-dependent DNA helicase [Citricoccus muralis]